MLRFSFGLFATVVTLAAKWARPARLAINKTNSAGFGAHSNGRTSGCRRSSALRAY
jgi:hypothetical protein